MTTKKKSNAGRPTKYKPEYCDRLIEWMSKGMSFETFGHEVGVVKDTLYGWVREYPEFSDAKKRAFLAAQVFWEKMAIDHMVSPNGEDGFTFNTSSWIFNMKNRFKWRDRVEHTGDDHKPIQIAYDPNK